MPKTRLRQALIATAERLRAGARYQWGHFGMCNCGHLAQSLTQHSHAEIHRAAVEQAADWGEAAVDYCQASGFPLDHIVTSMLDAGVTLGEIRHLERLSDPRILRELQGDRPFLSRNERDDVVLYLQTWAALLDAEDLPLAAE